MPTDKKSEVELNCNTQSESAYTASAMAGTGVGIQSLECRKMCLQEAWKSFQLDFNIYLQAMDMDKAPDQRKVAMMLHFIGAEGRKVFTSLGVNIEAVKLTELIKCFDDHYTKKKNITMERHKFFSHTQGEQTIEQFITSLRNLSFSCDFDKLREGLIKSVFICGLHSRHKDIKEKLLSSGDDSLKKTVEVAIIMEASKLSVEKLETEQCFAGKLTSEVNVVQQNKPQFRRPYAREQFRYRSGKASEQSSSKFRNASQEGSSSAFNKQSTSSMNRRTSELKSRQLGCDRCGMIHEFKCPAIGTQCHFCGGFDHFARRCKKLIQRKMNQVQQLFSDEEDDMDDKEGLFVGVLRRICTSKSIEKNQRWMITVAINGQSFKCQIDTGADTNVMALNDFLRLGYNRNDLKSTKTKIVGLGGFEVKIMGCKDIQFEYEGVKFRQTFYIMAGSTQGILGLPSIINMGILEQTKQSKNFNLKPKNINILSKNSWLERYKDLFEGLGSLEGKCHLTINPDIEPTVDSPRRIPFNLMQPLKAELDRMVNLKVISPVNEPTDWVNSIVLVKKTNGNLRICLDPRNLNKAIKRSHYQFPTIHDVKSQLTGARVFSTVDANSGFWTISLDEESSKLCTFITPFGRYKFLRLPFGISSAPEYFHSAITRLFEGIQNIVIYIDDILIFGRTRQEHDKALMAVFDRARKTGLKFNKSKTKLYQSEIKFLGHVFSEEGQKPDDDKVAAILKMKSPTSVAELQRFFGMVNYLGCFVKNLANHSVSLRELLKNDILWHWTERHEAEFNKLKQLITNAPVLTYYNPTKVLTLNVDASKNGIGCVLSHDRNPIAFASATLTSSQENYAQIEKELFAILVGCTKFHQYIYGQRILVETDHRPLVPLFNKPLYSVPARLQRFMMRLQAYDLEVKYKPGKEMFTADTLSRSSMPESILEEIDNDLRLHCNLVLSNIEINPDTLQSIKEAYVNDEAMKVLDDYVTNGWPENKKSVNPLAAPYSNVRDELHKIDGILLKLNRIIIPRSLRRHILNNLHEAHMGINRTENLARTCVYWPNISNDINNLVNSCDICQKLRKNKTKEPLKPHDIVDLPWHKLGMDLFEHENEHYLLIVDYYSKYVELANLHKNTTSSNVIRHIKSIFARHGIPKIIIADNAPQFRSREFQNFLNLWGVKNDPSSPYVANSNGLAERNIQTIKSMLTKCKATNSDPYLALLQFRTTPNASGVSPTQLLMSRLLRTRLPILNNNLRPKVVDSFEHNRKLEKYQQKMCDYYNKNAKLCPDFDPGQPVLFKKDPHGHWETGQILQKLDFPRSYIVQDPEGTQYRRNKKHILEDKASHNLEHVRYPFEEGENHNENNVQAGNCLDGNNEEALPETIDFSEDVEGIVKTRSGRVVKPVDRYGISKT